MSLRIKSFLGFVISIVLIVPSVSATRAQADFQPAYESSVYDLVNAVNALRAAYGLPAYSISSILMFTAQNQSDFMAANGIVTHSGPGGSTPTQRLLAAGYPLAGDLSLGGFRSENIIALSKNGSAEDAVSAWMGDVPHQTTMLSPNLSEIGAGMTVANGQVYYVIDCALPTTGGAVSLSDATAVVVAGSGVPEVGVVIYPVSVSTPNASGQVIHEVQAGQALWSIAIAYGVKIDEIKQLNNLVGNDIYPGEKLLIRVESVQTLTPPPETPMSTPTSSSTPTSTVAVSSTATVAVIVATPATPSGQNNKGGMLTALAIVLLAILGAWFFARTGGTRESI